MLLLSTIQYSIVYIFILFPINFVLLLMLMVLNNKRMEILRFLYKREKDEFLVDPRRWDFHLNYLSRFEESTEPNHS